MSKLSTWDTKEFSCVNEEVETYDDPHQTWKNHIYDLNRKKRRWKKRGNCASLSPKDMFPVKAERQTEVANKICKGCSTQVDCLYFAITSKEEFGVWGGMTEQQRKTIHKSLAKDGFGNFKTEWNDQYKDHFFSLTQFLVKHIDEEKTISKTQA